MENGGQSAEGKYICIRLGTENHAKAELLLSKLISDFSILPTVTKTEVRTDRLRLYELIFDGVRRILPLTHGQNAFVDLYYFADATAFEEFLAAKPEVLNNAFQLRERAHPYYLDR